MDMPRPGKEHAKLALLAGKWVGDETMHPGPMGPGGKSKGASVSKMSDDGFYLITSYKQYVGRKTTFRGHGVMAYDTFGKKYLWYWFDSIGMPPPVASCGVFKGSKLVYESDSPHGKARYTYAFKGDDRYRFTIEMSNDGGATWGMFMEGDYKRA